MKSLKDRAMELRDSTAAQARSEYIGKVMKWEECDYETAYYICIGRTDPREPEYTLGYKMADPIMMMAMFGQVRKKKRELARDEFRRMLEPDELPLFEEYVNKDDTEKQWKKAYKEEKKNKGVKE